MQATDGYYCFCIVDQDRCEESAQPMAVVKTVEEKETDFELSMYGKKRRYKEYMYRVAAVAGCDSTVGKYTKSRDSRTMAEQACFKITPPHARTSFAGLTTVRVSVRYHYCMY